MTLFLTPFLKRNFLRIVSVILFAAILYGLNNFVSILDNRIQHLEFISLSLMVMMSFVIMFFWALLGVFWGLASFLTAMIFLYGPLTDLSSYYYSILIIAFFLSSFIGYYVYRRIGIASQNYTVVTEKIHEEANLISNHMKNRKAEVSAMSEKMENLFSVKNIAESLSLALSSEEVARLASEQTFRLFGEDKRIALFIVDEPLEGFNLVYKVKGLTRAVFAEEKGGIFETWVRENAKSLLVKDIKKDFRFSATESEKKDDALSLMIKPLVIDGNVLGMLRVDSPKENAFSQHELRVLDIVGELTSVALRNTRLYRKTRELAVKDSLTGLYVYRYFMERLDEEVKRAVRSGKPFAFLMLDIDDFKVFNDKYGHISGDTILRKIGCILTSRASAGDVVARYGGEEFVFLILDCSKKQAVSFAEEIRKKIQDTPVTLRRNECFVTASIGVAVFPEDAKLKEEIIWKADKCLYEAKAKGKNTVCPT